MDLLDDWPAIRSAVFSYAPATGLTDRTKGFLDQAKLAASPVVMAATTCEALYAARAQLDAPGRTLCGQLASFCAQHGFHGMGDASNRGLGIYTAMRRDLGEVPAGDGDPEPAEDYAPTLPEPEPAAEEG